MSRKLRIKNDSAWMKQAACKGKDTNMFYPVDVTGEYDQLSKVQKLCDSCPVKLRCLDYALSQPFDEDGYWGRTTPKDRKALKERAGDQHALYGDAASELAMELVCLS